jgi:hypothetical protein
MSDEDRLLMRAGGGEGDRSSAGGVSGLVRRVGVWGMVLAAGLVLVFVLAVAALALADRSVGSSQLKSGAVTWDKLAADSVRASALDQSVTGLGLQLSADTNSIALESELFPNNYGLARSSIAMNFGGVCHHVERSLSMLNS